MEKRPAAMQENEIITRVLAGETRAFALLVDRHKEKAMALAVRMLGNREDAEEALQDAFIRAFRSLARFEQKAKFSTWLYRIVFNVCYSVLRVRGPVVFESEPEYVPERFVESDRPDTLCEGAELQKIVHEAIDALPSAYGTVFTLYMVNEMSYDEIAETTGLPINTVKTRIFRGRALLRSAVAGRFNDAAADDLMVKEKR